MAGLILRPFAIEDESDALAAHQELTRDNFEFLLERNGMGSWPEYLDRLADVALGRRLAPGRVRMALLAAEVGGRLVGRASIRFALNEWLTNYGGHIGYAVRPAFRRRGYASEILRQSLVVARAGGVRDVLMYCTDVNVGSATVIERAGGELEAKVADQRGTLLRRYWIRF